MKNTSSVRSKITKKQFVLLLGPSWLSGLVAVVIALTLSLGVLGLYTINSAGIKQDLNRLAYNSHSSQAILTLPGQNPPGANESTTITNTWPLIAFWAFIGLLAYFIVEELYSVISNAKRFSQQLSYVNAHPEKQLMGAAVNIVIRVLMLIICLLFVNYFFKGLIPKCVNYADLSLKQSQGLKKYEYLVEAFGIALISSHLVTVLLRLSLNRPRILSSANYLDV